MLPQLLLILCGFLIMHPGPNYVHIPSIPPSANAILIPKQNLKKKKQPINWTNKQRKRKTKRIISLSLLKLLRLVELNSLPFSPSIFTCECSQLWVTGLVGGLWTLYTTDNWLSLELLFDILLSWVLNKFLILHLRLFPFLFPQYLDAGDVGMVQLTVLFLGLGGS